jgi:hypothetical protein
LGIERCIGKGAAVYVHCGRIFGGDWSLTTLFRELKMARTLKDTWVWREPSDAIKGKGVEGTASTMELTLFFCFFGWRIRPGDMGVAFQHHRGVKYRLIYALRAGKELSGIKMMDRMEFVAITGAASFGARRSWERQLYTQQGGSYGVHSIYDDQSACEIDYGMC